MPTQSKTKAVELDDLKDQFEALRDDMKEMTELISAGVAERAVTAKDKAVDAAATLSTDAKKKASQLHADAESAITANPLAAVAICAGIGFLLGAVSRR